MKATFKNVCTALILLAMALVVLWAVDLSSNVPATSNATKLRVTVVDLDGLPLHNAKVTVGQNTFFTDNKGRSPLFDVSDFSNCYDANVTQWGTVNVVATKQNYVASIALNCVVYRGQNSSVTVKLYPDDGKLPFVCYVQTPPNDYLQGLIPPN